MAIVTTDDKHYKNIAAVVRSCTGSSSLYKPSEMADAVYEASEVRFDDGRTSGYMEGYTQGHEEGIQAEYDRFWDAFQENGNRTDYEYAFVGVAWTDEIFKPKYNITPTKAPFAFTSSKISNIKNALERAGVTLDTSNCTNMNRIFYGSATTVLPKIDFRAYHAIDNAFTICSQLVEVSIVVDETVSYTDAFFSCSALENLTIEGTIGQNGFNVSWSTKLTHESLMSIINALQDKTSAGGTWSITLGTANLAKLTDAEKAIATQKGWTLA